MDSISEVLNIISQENPLWKPKNIMVDFSLAEIGAIKQCFPSKTKQSNSLFWRKCFWRTYLMNGFFGLETHIHVCDFHREKAWNEWINKRSNGTYLYKHELLQLLRNIANSTSQIALQKNIDALKNSHLWKESLQLQKYFDEFWGLHLQVLISSILCVLISVR